MVHLRPSLTCSDCHSAGPTQGPPQCSQPTSASQEEEEVHTDEPRNRHTPGLPELRRGSRPRQRLTGPASAPSRAATTAAPRSLRLAPPASRTAAATLQPRACGGTKSSLRCESTDRESESTDNHHNNARGPLFSVCCRRSFAAFRPTPGYGGPARQSEKACLRRFTASACGRGRPPAHRSRRQTGAVSTLDTTRMLQDAAELLCSINP